MFLAAASSPSAWIAGGHTGGRGGDISNSFPYIFRPTLLGLLRKDEGGVFTSEVVTTNIEHLSVLNQAPNLGLLQVVQSIVVRGAQISAHAAVVAGNDHATAAGRLGRLDAVLDPQAGLLDGITQDGGVLVVADAAQVDDTVVGQQVLGAAGRVLRGAAGDELGVVVVEELLVEGLVRVLGEDRVVGLEVVFGEELVRAEGLDVCIGGGGPVSAGKLGDQVGDWG